MFQGVEIGRHTRTAGRAAKARGERLLSQARIFACGCNRLSECLHNYPFSFLQTELRRDNWSTIYADIGNGIARRVARGLAMEAAVFRVHRARDPENYWNVRETLWLPGKALNLRPSCY